MNPIQKYMLRLILFGAGKTIIHKNTLCEVVETHDQIRRLLPLVDRDLTESKVKPFWVPRRSVNRKEMRKERIHRQYVSGLRKVFTAPHYVGEPRPDFHPVPLEAVFTAPPFYQELVEYLKPLGAPESWLVRTSVALARWIPRRRKIHAAPTAAQLEARSRMRSKNPRMPLAVMEVNEGADIVKVARKYGLKIASLRRTLARNQARADSITETA